MSNNPSQRFFMRMVINDTKNNPMGVNLHTLLVSLLVGLASVLKRSLAQASIELAKVLNKQTLTKLSSRFLRNIFDSIMNLKSREEKLKRFYLFFLFFNTNIILFICLRDFCY